MAVWLLQGLAPGFQAHAEHLLGFRHGAATSLPDGLPCECRANALSHAGKLGSDEAKATQLNRGPSTKVGKMADL